jgi:hypothetical protein
MLAHPLAYEIAVIVAIKTAIVMAAALLVFGPARVDVSATSVEAHVFHSTSETNQ